MTAAKPPARQRAVGALASGFATDQLHHARGHDLRREISGRLTKTLRADLRRRLPRLYAEALRGLVTELSRFGEAHVAARFPERCPYTLEQVLGD